MQVPLEGKQRITETSEPAFLAGERQSYSGGGHTPKEGVCLAIPAGEPLKAGDSEV